MLLLKLVIVLLKISFVDSIESIISRLNEISSRASFDNSTSLCDAFKSFSRCFLFLSMVLQPVTSSCAFIKVRYMTVQGFIWCQSITFLLWHNFKSLHCHRLSSVLQLTHYWLFHCLDLFPLYLAAEEFPWILDKRSKCSKNKFPTSDTALQHYWIFV